MFALLPAAVSKYNSNVREAAAFKKRKRYFLGSTFKKGHGWPLAWMISPNKFLVSSLARGLHKLPSGLYRFEVREIGIS